MVPQLVLFVGDVLTDLSSQTYSYIQHYLESNADIKLYEVVQKSTENITLQSVGKSESVFTEGSLVDKLDKVYQEVNSIHNKNYNTGFNVIVISSPYNNGEHDHLISQTYDAVYKLYMAKQYLLSFSWVLLTDQLCREIAEIGHSRSVYTVQYLEEIKQKFKDSPFSASLVILDNQNILGKGLGLTKSTLAAVLAEYIGVLYTNQVSIFNSWKPIAYTFSLSSLFYDLPWVRERIEERLYLEDIIANNFLQKDSNILEFKDIINSLTSSLIQEVKKLSKELYELILDNKKEDKTADWINDVKNKWFRESFSNFRLEKLENFIFTKEYTLGDKVNVLSVLLGQYKLPVGEQLISTLEYYLYKKICSHKNVLDEIEIPNYLDILNDKENAQEQYKAIKHFFLENEYRELDIDGEIKNLQNHKSILEGELGKIQPYIRRSHSILQMLFKSSNREAYIRKEKELEEQIRELEQEHTSLKNLERLECEIHSFKLVSQFIENWKIRLLKVEEKNVTLLSRIDRSLAYKKSHPLLNSLEEWTSFNEFLLKEIKPFEALSENLNLSYEEFVNLWEESVASRRTSIYNLYLKRIAFIKQWLVDNLKSDNLPVNKSNLLKSVFKLNLSPFVHATSYELSIGKAASFLLLNYDRESTDEEVELQSLLGRFTNTRPTLSFISNRFKILTIDFHEILDIGACTGFK